MSEKEFDKQIAKEGLQTGVATYEGICEKPKEGKAKTGKDWRMFKANFKFKGRERNNKFIVWTPLTPKSIGIDTETDLVAFDKFYKIVWKEEEKSWESPEGLKEWVQKTILVINEATEEDITEMQTTQNTLTQKSIIPKVTVEEMIKYDQFFVDMCEEHKITPNKALYVGGFLLKLYGNEHMIKSLNDHYESIKWQE